MDIGKKKIISALHRTNNHNPKIQTNLYIAESTTADREISPNRKYSPGIPHSTTLARIFGTFASLTKYKNKKK